MEEVGQVRLGTSIVNQQMILHVWPFWKVNKFIVMDWDRQSLQKTRFYFWFRFRRRIFLFD